MQSDDVIMPQLFLNSPDSKDESATTRFQSVLAILMAGLLVSVFASSASALSTDFGGAGDPSLHGATGSLFIDGRLLDGTETFDVVCSMDSTDYEASVGDHQDLTDVAFKPFTHISVVRLDRVSWLSSS